MKKKGISLITLIITIVVVIILAAAVILALGRNNPITDSRVATISQTKDSLQSGILVYIGDVVTKTLGLNSAKEILTSDDSYKLVTGDIAPIIKDGAVVRLYKLDETAVKERLNVEIKNTTSSSWYIDEQGRVYLVYEDMDSVPSHYKENDSIISSLSDVVKVKAANIYLIEYDTNGGSIVQSINTTKGETITISSAPTKDNATFLYWQDTNGTHYNPGVTYNVDDNMTFEAIWSYVLSYNVDGVITNETKIEGEDTTIKAAPTKNNTTFMYWQDISGNHYSAGATYTENTGLTLTAVWGYSAANINAMTDTEKQSVIGKNVSLTSTNGWTDWKVFSSDGTKIMLITGDYIPVSILPSGHGFASGSYNTTYCVNSSTSRDDLLTKLTTASTFNGFKDSAGKVTTARIPTIQDFALSYNAVTHAGPTYADSTYPSGYPRIQKVYYKDNGVNGGYNVSSDVNGVTSNDNVPNNSYWSNYGLPRTETNYGNLWVIEDYTKAYSYWLASKSSISTGHLLDMHFEGYVNYTNYGYAYRGLRPVVVLDSSVKLVQNIDGSNITYTLE